MEVVAFGLEPYQLIVGLSFIVLMLFVIFFPDIITWPVVALVKNIRKRLNRGDSNRAAE